MDTLTGGAGSDVFIFTNVINLSQEPGGSYYVQSADGFDIIKDFNILQDAIQSYVPATPNVPAHFKHVAGTILKRSLGFGFANSNLVSQNVKIDFSNLVSDRVNFATLFDSSLNLSVLE